MNAPRAALYILLAQAASLSLSGTTHGRRPYYGPRKSKRKRRKARR